MTAPGGEMKGELAEGVVPGLLRKLYVGRLTGTLHFTKGSEEQSVRVRRGHIVNARTNVTQERLGEILVRHDRLSEADLERATEVVLREKKRLGEVLVELGFIDQAGLEDAVALRVHEMLTKVFAWNEGAYRFEEEEEAPGELTLKLSTGELILEAVRAIQDPDVIRYLLGDMDRILTPSSDPILRFQKLGLTPNDGFVLSRVDGTLSAREVEQLIPLPPEEVRRSLLGLISTGILEYSDDKTRPRPETEAASPVGRPAAEATGAREPKDEDEQVAEGAPAEEPAEEQPTAEEPAAEEEEPAEEPAEEKPAAEEPIAQEAATDGLGEEAAAGTEEPADEGPPPDTVPVQPVPAARETEDEAAPPKEEEPASEGAKAPKPDTSPVSEAARKPDTAPVSETPPSPDTAPTPEPETGPRPDTAPVSEPQAGSEPEDGPAAERRREIEEAWTGLKEKDHFEVLGLTTRASAAEVKEAYFKLAKRFHPDVHHGSSLGDLRDKLESVFIRLGEAYEVLRDPEKRGDYEDRLKRFKPRPATPDAPGGAGGGPVGEEPSHAPTDEAETQAERMEAAVTRAEKLYDAARKAGDDPGVKQKYWEAIQLIDPIVGKLTGKTRLRGRLVLARCLMENPNWVKRAEETLRVAVEEQPEAADAYGLLGELYAQQGLRARAAGMFRRALELRPEGQGWAEALARLEGRQKEGPDDEGGGGLLRKIFKR